MSEIEHNPRRFVLKSGSTSLTLDKEANKATLQRKVLFWKLKPVEAALSDIASITIDKMVDRGSGVETYSTMIVIRAGAGWSLRASDKTEAEKNALALRGFLGLE
jgi:hypothetical protein